ncbi:Arc family DNA-binding protein [Methylobacterium terricola]|uniref:Arc family DNA-binding protein n=2 Tax=Methylobacterium terricola TaxID=2583531 RepID=A0A5C4LPE0_9HYPH|nr:Arc family DNA-binding protein [Methylobacterium terricola]
MSKPPAPSDLADKFMLRMPEGMRDRIARAAKANGRSMNAEIVQTLEDHYPPETELRDLMHWIEEVVWHANAHNWRDNRKILVEALRILREKINDEAFDPAEMARPPSYIEKMQAEQMAKSQEEARAADPSSPRRKPDP